MNDGKSKKNGQWVPTPGRLAICRVLAGDDLAAGALLYQIVGLWKVQTKKLERNGYEWLAMPRYAWARTAGLTLPEFDKRGWKRLKTYCSEFVIHGSGWKLPDSGLKGIWLRVEHDAFLEAVQHVKDNWEMIDLGQKGHGIGFNKASKYLGKTDTI